MPPPIQPVRRTGGPVGYSGNPPIQMTYHPEVIAKFRNMVSGHGMSMASELQNLTWMWSMSVDGYTITDLFMENEELIWSDGQGMWVDNTPAHDARKAKRGLNPLKMVMTERLYDTVTVLGHPDQIAFGDANNYWFGVNVENYRGEGGWAYPEIHQFLGDSKGNTRPFMYIREETRQRLDAFFGRAVEIKLQEVAGRSGLRSARVRRR